MKYTMYVSGYSKGNPGPAGVGVLIYDANNRKTLIRIVCNPIGVATNNAAEYEALIEGLLTVLQMRLKDVAIFSDSSLVVSQVNGVFGNKDEVIDYRLKAKNLKKLIHNCTLSLITNEENKTADAVAKRASGIKPRYRGGNKEDETKVERLD